jgi:kynurenine formamidase
MASAPASTLSARWTTLPITAPALGIDNLAAHPVQGRGVMVDLEAHFGRGESFVGYDALMRILEKDKVEVEEGDLVCFRTGYDRTILDMNKRPDAATLAANPGAGLDGRDERLLNWITKSGVVALISDNRAVEQMPSRPCEGEDICASLPLHGHCLFKLGVYLGEIWYLSELADWLRENGRSRFLLTAPPLRLPRAVGSPANAVATV